MYTRRKEQIIEAITLVIFLIFLILAVGYMGYTEQQDEIFIYNNL